MRISGSLEAALKGAPARRVCKNQGNLLPGDGHHRLVSVQQLADVDPWNVGKIIRVFVKLKNNGQALTSQENVIQSTMATKIYNAVLTDWRFVDHVWRILFYASTFETISNKNFSEPRTVGICRDVQESDFIHGSSLQNCRRHAHAYWSIFLRAQTCFNLSSRKSETFSEKHIL